MATATRGSFDRALQSFRDKLTEDQKRDFPATTLDDVTAEIQRIQERLGSEKKLRNLGRLSKFLEAMNEIEKVVNVFLNVSEVVAFVWGPIKLVLVVAATRVETLESLLDTYVEIGEVVPGLQKYDQLFRNAPWVIEILERYVCDILEFHRSALDVFARPCEWTNRRKIQEEADRLRQFGPILESLKRHRELLLDERLNAAIMEIQVTRQQTLDSTVASSTRANQRFDELSSQLQKIYSELVQKVYDAQHASDERRIKEQTESLLHSVAFITDKLQPPDYEADQYFSFDQHFVNSGSWILDYPAFLRWHGSKLSRDTTLYINGKPGAGKTVLASNIISHMRTRASSSANRCLFFYFKHQDDTKRTFAYMLRALVVQLLYQDSTIVEFLYEKCSSISPTEARAPATLKNWLLETLKSQNACSVILDGLDECEDDVATDIIKWFQDSVQPECWREGSTIRLLVSAQRNGIIDKALSKSLEVRLDDVAAHSEDIHSFLKLRAGEIAQRFRLSPGDELQLVDKIAESSEGMFLYAKVVSDNLLAQASVAEYEEEMSANFPDGLDAAYERVSFRVLDSPRRHRSHKESTRKILGWMTCAFRSLRWREIQAMFCIDPSSGLCNAKLLREDDCKTLCGSIVEIERSDASFLHENMVNLVHSTARRYLIQSNRVDILGDNARIALFSSRYLTSPPFGVTLGDHSVVRLRL